MSRSANDAAPAGGPVALPAAAPRASARALTFDQYVLAAAESHGRDGTGSGGTVGYVLHLADKEPRIFASLLAKALLGACAEEGGGLPQQIAFHTVYEHADR
jgi:hypothetical protein